MENYGLQWFDRVRVLSRCCRSVEREHQSIAANYESSLWITVV
uniref:Uncharacterized protein n=1 Tax=Siphoviridae sp. ctYkG6 TaxID=2825551 RepID=A0A8S5VCK4_9CAUD|nr:MAG TPA: hypothetical protein [Siphoviridae sp. ctYkG6]